MQVVATCSGPWGEIGRTWPHSITEMAACQALYVYIQTNVLDRIGTNTDIFNLADISHCLLVSAECSVTSACNTQLYPSLFMTVSVLIWTIASAVIFDYLTS